MAKDMHKEEWDSATLTKLDVFEQYIDDWLSVTLNYAKDKHVFQTLEVYDLFCGSGYDGTKTYKGSPLRILDAVLKRNCNGKKIKIYFNDNDENKIKQLESIIIEQYPNLENKNVEVKYISSDTQSFKLYSNNYYKLIFLDQYGIQHINKVKEFLCKGTDILIFISSGHCRRFLEEESFKKYLDTKYISKEDFEGKQVIKPIE
ncbi:three-Cys-motif partner protein TcmP [Helicobacter trogontum]|uniref:Three-Cys-motif partner protein TcmP n=1 Tax=Helicobacter trogontum TaxID=50960 RepID=A0A4U8S6M7_9HELI|nr:three-Cys-motif partner protein TcmP [Helicobacter trogontum]TLD81456.1 three-Cys-motif partner protein TcmP [Helicobacter trogontum]